MPSPFDVLQIDPDADDEEIERAYRQRVKEAHPDQGGSTREFQAVRAAYEALAAADREARPVEHDLDDLAETRREQRQETRVEYLNYEVLDDHGWEIDDEDLFEAAATADLAPEDHGRFVAQADETLLQAAENHGFTWPYACRGGACANCAVAVLEGDISMPVDHILPAELLDAGIRLSCGGVPTTRELKVVYNVKHLPVLEDLRLPPGPFKQASADR